MSDVITHNSRWDEIIKEHKRYPTLETRLVPIDIHNSVKNFLNAYNAYTGVFMFCKLIDNGADGYFENYDGLEVHPTHFLQFKINGEWTHEFKMGEE